MRTLWCRFEQFKLIVPVHKAATGSAAAAVAALAAAPRMGNASRALFFHFALSAAASRHQGTSRCIVLQLLNG